MQSVSIKRAAHAVNVRTIAETYYEGGDLFADINAIERMQEGLKGHLELERAYPPGYRAEVPVRFECEIEGVSLCVQGRVDGLCLTGDSVIIEEIKTTRKDALSISESDYPVHWAQAEIYARIVAEKEGFDSATVRLVYYNLTGARAVYTRSYTLDRLRELFIEYALPYARALGNYLGWRAVSLRSALDMSFPFDTYREGQLNMVKHSYIALRDSKKLLVQAPTGIGKTVAALFPALRALGEGLVETVFYLTARTTGRIACSSALELMRARGLKARSVIITAKKKACPMPRLNCAPDACPYARGYYDRHRGALDEAAGIECLDEARIRELSAKYTLCPFELSLSLAEKSEVVICDYNYVFDPMVRLRRFFDRRGSYALLVDEAHNLTPRAREMYSAELDAGEIADIRRRVGRELGRKDIAYACLTRLLSALSAPEEPEISSQLPSAASEAAGVFIEDMKQALPAASACPELMDLYFRTLNFVRVAGEFDMDTHRALTLPEGKRARVKLWCWQPTGMIRAAMKKMRGSVLFSATLSPISHYARELGLSENEGDATLSLPSPFPSENLCVLRLPIPTRYRAREDTAHRVAKAIYDMARAKPGNYLACFPSHAYLNRIAELFGARYPDIRVHIQKTQMDERERAEYVDAFVERPDKSMVAFIALGGVFSEGIDLPGDRLTGAAIVGVGLPQIGFERDQLKALYDDKDENGFETAYVYPGISKCLQAAGRVIRSHEDRGCVLLIDDRYALNEYKSLLPQYWRVRPAREDSVYALLREFFGAPRAAYDEFGEMNDAES